MLRRISVLIVAMGLGCGSGQTTKTIGPEGGTVTFGPLDLVIPAGALSQSQLVKISEGSGGDLRWKSLSKVFHIEPAGLVLRVPAEITIHVDSPPASGSVFSTAIGSTARWNRMVSRANETAVLGQLDHLGDVQALVGAEGGIGYQSHRTTTLTQKPVARASGDFDGDGDPDFAWADAQGGVHLLLGKSASSWTAVEGPVVAGHPFGMTAVDLGVHGRKDLVVGVRADDGSVSLVPLVNTGAPALAALAALPLGTLADAADAPELIVRQEGTNLYVAVTGGFTDSAGQVLTLVATADKPMTLTASAPAGSATIPLAQIRPFFFARPGLTPELGVVGIDATSTQLVGFTTLTGALQSRWTQVLIPRPAADYDAHAGDAYHIGYVALSDPSGAVGSSIKITSTPPEIVKGSMAPASDPAPEQDFYIRPGDSDEVEPPQVQNGFSHNDHQRWRNYMQVLHGTDVYRPSMLGLAAFASMFQDTGDHETYSLHVRSVPPVETEISQLSAVIKGVSFDNANPFDWTNQAQTSIPMGAGVDIYQDLDALLIDVETTLGAQWALTEYVAEGCMPPLAGEEQTCDPSNIGSDMGVPTDGGTTSTVVISNVLPSSGKPGDIIEIDGTHVQGQGLTVSFNGVASPTIYTNGFGGNIGAVVPNGATNGLVTVTNSNGSNTWPTLFRVAYPPNITNMTPTSGGSGTVVRFTGTHFENLDLAMGASLTGIPYAGANSNQTLSLVADGADQVVLQLPTFTTTTSTCTLMIRLQNIGNGNGGAQAPNFTLTGDPNCP